MAFNNEDFMEYGISLNYVQKWTLWDCVRELVSNAHDTGKPFVVVAENNTLTIQDEGDGIHLPDLLLGEHNSGVNTIGQFGEGLKVAALVLMREGHKTEIFSNDLHIHFVESEKFERKILRAEWEYVDPIPGTKIVVSNWTTGDYADHFIFTDDDYRVIDSNIAGSILDDNKLFSKGVYTCDLSGYHFGYNILTLAMNRDRSAVNEQEIYEAVGKIWSNENSSYAWREFIKATIDNQTIEKMIRLYYYNMEPSARAAFKKAWFETQGDHAVVKTDDNAEREAKHRGAKVINLQGFSNSVYSTICNIVGTDVDYIEKHGGVKPKKATKLDAAQKKNLSLCKRIGKKVNCDFEVVPGIEMPEGALGLCDHSTKTIWLREDQLADALTSGSIMIHELAHALYHTDDMTERHCKKMCDIGMMISGLAD